jgi:hypothetical protein
MQQSITAPPTIRMNKPSAIGELQSQLIDVPLYPPLEFVIKQYRYSSVDAMVGREGLEPSSLIGNGF